MYAGATNRRPTCCYAARGPGTGPTRKRWWIPKVDRLCQAAVREAGRFSSLNSLLTTSQIRQSHAQRGVQGVNFIGFAQDIDVLQRRLLEGGARVSGLATADAIVYATALQQGIDLLTCDGHFEGLHGVTLFSKTAQL
jgi:hypothetical protein